MKGIKKFIVFLVFFMAFFMFYDFEIFFLFFGILMVCYGIINLIYVNYFVKNGVESVGEIVSYKLVADEFLTPIIEFNTLKGETIKQKPCFFADLDFFLFRALRNEKSKRITVIYNERNPEKFVIKTNRFLNVDSVLIILLGLFFLVLSIWYFPTLPNF